jgi:hypothetical protein
MDTRIGDLVLKPIPEGVDLLPIVDVSVDETKKIDIKSLWDAKDARFQSPVFTYGGGGELTVITYSDGSTKTFTYSSGALSVIDFQIFGYAYLIRKTLNYTLGVLTSIDEEIV